MVGRLLNLVDALDCERGARPYLFERLARNHAHLRVNLADGDLHIEPLLKFSSFRPERAHFGQCVTGNHFGCRGPGAGCQLTVVLSGPRHLIPDPYFKAFEFTKYLAKSQCPSRSTRVKVSMPSPLSNVVL